MKTPVLALALLLPATPLFALADAPADGAKETQVEDPMICRREAPTGTRFAKRICVRKSTMEAREKQDQADMKEQMDRPQINPAGKD